MLAVFWTCAGVALLLALLQLTVALRLSSHVKPVRSPASTEPRAGSDDGTMPVVPAVAVRSGVRPNLSALVPLKGAPVGLEERLQGLLTALRDGDQLVLAVESEDDPAHQVAAHLAENDPGREVDLVLSGPAGERMGKQHNLTAALTHAKHGLIAFMDDDVLIERANLDEAAAVVEESEAVTTSGQGSAPWRGVGAAFAMPFYGVQRGSASPIGGDLVAAYTNHGFTPNMASLALQGPPKFIIGGFWMTSRAALESIGGLEQFTATVGDDAAIGRAFDAAGRRNVLLGHPVRLEPERLGPGGGVRHLLKWLTLLRAEGLGVLLICLLTWNPLAIGLLACVLSWVAPGQSGSASLYVLAVLVILRSFAVLTLDARVYGLKPIGNYLPMQLVYESLIAPWLFLVAAFRREVVWRGRRYRVLAGGRSAQQR